MCFYNYLLYSLVLAQRSRKNCGSSTLRLKAISRSLEQTNAKSGNLLTAGFTNVDPAT